MNLRHLAPKASALTKLRYTPNADPMIDARPATVKVILPVIIPARVPEEQLDIEDHRLTAYRDRQIVDASAEPREATFIVEHTGEQRTVSFHAPTLTRIKARLEQLGIGAANLGTGSISFSCFLIFHFYLSGRNMTALIKSLGSAALVIISKSLTQAPIEMRN